MPRLPEDSGPKNESGAVTRGSVVTGPGVEEWILRPPPHCSPRPASVATLWLVVSEGGLACSRQSYDDAYELRWTPR